MNFSGKLKNTFSMLLASVRRFPQTIVFCIATAVMFIILSHGIYWGNAQESNVRLMMSFALMIPLFTTINLFFERKPYNLSIKIITNILALVLGYLVYVFLLKDLRSFQNIMSYILLFLFFTLTYFYVPYNSRKNDYVNYILKLFTNFVITIVYTLVLTLGIFAILFTIDRLFGLHIEGEIYRDIWIVLFTVFAPTYYLSKNPTQEDNLDDYYPPFIKILLSFIILPLLTAYSAILYAYFAKIIVTRIWPIGLVGNLVLWSVLLGVVSLFFVSPVTQDNKWLTGFKKWYPIFSIPLILMMFISLGIRLKAYGITESRYGVLVLGLWELAIMLYFIITKVHKNVVLPISLSLLILISGFTPIGAFSISKINQNHRIQAIFNKYHMIKDNKIVKASVTPDPKDIKEMRSILDYFQTYHKITDIKYMPHNFSFDKATYLFGFDLYAAEYDYKANRYFNIALKEGMSIDIQGYKYLLNATNSYGGRTKSDNGISYELSRDAQVLTFYKGNTVIYKKDINTQFNNIINNNITQAGFGGDNSIVDKQQSLTFKDSNDKIDFKFVFTTISGDKNVNTNEVKNPYFTAYVMYNLK